MEEKVYIYLDKNGNSNDIQIDEFQYEIDQDEYARLHLEVANHNSIETIKELKYKNTGEPYVDEYANPNYELQLLDNLRLQRQRECFPVVNRGKLWHDTLTETQLNELEIWYNAWLEVTETKVIPERLEWL